MLAISIRSTPGSWPDGSASARNARLATLAMRPREPIGRQPAHRRRGTNEHATPVLGDHQPLVLQILDGIADRHPGDLKVRRKIRLGRQPITRLQLATLYLLPQH